jgi:membrane associated rhomboid family serine protease
MSMQQEDHRGEELDGPENSGQERKAPWQDDPWQEARNRREPIFNMPAVIVAITAILTFIHGFRMYLLSPEQDTNLIYMLGFIPASYGQFSHLAPYPYSGLWSPFTYGLLHGDWLHLLMNVFWMAAFGTPVARRLGPMRFLLLAMIASLGGALLHYVSYSNEFVPVIGASGSISGFMGAAGRFAFVPVRGVRGLRTDGPALGILQSFQNRQFVTFFAVWMGLNYLFGAGIVGLSPQDAPIAWQAHIGGFLAGFLAFSFLDPQKPFNKP